MENFKKITRVILLIIYVCALPFTVILAFFSPIVLADTSINDFHFQVSYILGFLVPISIIIALIKSIIAYRKHQNHSWIILLLPLIVFAFWELSTDGVRYYRQNKFTESTYVPLSQRGNPVPATDVPVTLPPDPGEAGKQTLAGIDSNNDGVRDDLEREIVYMYPQNDEVRRVLRAMVKAEQDFIVTEGDQEHFKEVTIKQFAFKNCYEYLLWPKGFPDYTNGDILTMILNNTKKRSRLFISNTKKAASFSFELSNSQSCNNPIIKGQY